MTVKLMDNPGKADDVIRRETAINTVTEKEGWYPASLWYVPPADPWRKVADDPATWPPIGTCLVWLRKMQVVNIAFFWPGIERFELPNGMYVELNEVSHWCPMPEPPKEEHNG